MALTGLRNVIETIKAISRSAKLHSGNESGHAAEELQDQERQDLAHERLSDLIAGFCRRLFSASFRKRFLIAFV